MGNHGVGRREPDLLRGMVDLVFPGTALVLAVFCFNLLGDGLRDMIDPRGGRGV